MCHSGCSEDDTGEGPREAWGCDEEAVGAVQPGGVVCQVCGNRAVALACLLLPCSSNASSRNLRSVRNTGSRAPSPELPFWWVWGRARESARWTSFPAILLMQASLSRAPWSALGNVPRSPRKTNQCLGIMLLMTPTSEGPRCLLLVHTVLFLLRTKSPSVVTFPTFK